MPFSSKNGLELGLEPLQRSSRPSGYDFKIRDRWPWCWNGCSTCDLTREDKILHLSQKSSLLSRQFQGISCGHHRVLRVNLPIQSGALNWVWVVENLTLSSLTGIQKEGQRSVLKYIRYCHFLFSCDLLFPGGGLKGNWKIPVHWLWSCHGDLIRKFMHKNSREGLYWQGTKAVKETFEIAQLLFWRFYWSHLFEMKTAIASSKLPRENFTKQKFFVCVQIIPLSAKQCPLEQSPAPTAKELRGQKAPH